MDEDYLKPYRRIQAAEELVNSNALLDRYVELYRKKYKGLPIFPKNNSHLTAIKDFQKNAGSRAFDLLEVFFNSKNEWYIKQCHSLDCLNRSLHQLGAIASQKQGSGEAVLADLEVFCDACGKKIRIAATNADGFRRCKDCETKNRPQRVTTKAERVEANIKIGGKFLDMPEDGV